MGRRGGHHHLGADAREPLCGRDSTSQSTKQYRDDRPKTLHLSGEFTESNLGTRVEANGQVTTRIVATQFAFLPHCVLVPADTRVTLRLSSPDVIHGILVTGTNVNTMVVPGYVAQVHTVFTKTGDLLMPCHEFCGFGHNQMLARVHVVPQNEFHPDANGKASCAER
jgi:cytochrome c oxidase subunit II